MCAVQKKNNLCGKGKLGINDYHKKIPIGQHFNSILLFISYVKLNFHFFYFFNQRIIRQLYTYILHHQIQSFIEGFTLSSVAYLEKAKLRAELSECNYLLLVGIYVLCQRDFLVLISRQRKGSLQLWLWLAERQVHRHLACWHFPHSCF